MIACWRVGPTAGLIPTKTPIQIDSVSEKSANAGKLILAGQYNIDKSPLKNSKNVFMYVCPSKDKIYAAAPGIKSANGWITFKYTITDEVDELVLYLRNDKGKTDDNLGAFWTHTVQDLMSAEVEAD